VVTKWLLEVLNVPPVTLEIKPRVNQKSLLSRPAFGFIISGAGSIKLQRRSSLNLLGEAGTDFQISK
jgi:hypothetical protein